MSFAAAVLFLAGCACEKPRPEAGKTAPPLFVHFFTPALYFENSTEPPKLIATAPVHLSQPFAVEHLGGVVEPRKRKYYARLRGECGGTTSHVDGELELEKPICGGGAFAGYIPVFGFYVLSTNADCGPFLKEAASVK